MDFYEKLSTYYDQLFPLRELRLSFILSELSKQSKTLDIGCATGELAIALSNEGHLMTGIDLDEEMVDIAKNKIKNSKTDISFIAENMLNIDSIFKTAEFDTVLCFGNTLVHLKDPAEIVKFFRSIRSILKQGGTFILQIVNYDKILKNNIRTLPDLKREGLLFERKYKNITNLKNLEFVGTLTVGKNKIVNTEILCPLTSVELQKALIDAGFKDIKLYGDEKHSEYTVESPAIIAVVKK